MLFVLINPNQAMITINPKNIPVAKWQGYILGAIAPRPIAFVSTIDKNGNSNLSPFSFFNAFSTNPPICVFSPARRPKDNTNKHTYDNVKEIDEAVINAVNYDLVQQASLSSSEFPKEDDEFIKSGLTPIPSVMVKPFRVKESPVQMECKVKNIIELGAEGGAGNLVICEILLMHINENVLDENGVIDPRKIDLVARLGGNWYSRASGNSLFEVEKPLRTIGIGVDKISEHIRKSKILTGNNLGQLGNVDKLPSKEEIDDIKMDKEIINLLALYRTDPVALEKHIHIKAKKLLEQGEVKKAWTVLMTI